MKKFFVLLGALALVISWAGAGLAESDTDTHSVVININEVADLDLDNTGDIIFTIEGTGTGGDAFEVSENVHTKYLQYTSIVPSDNEKRKITVVAGGGADDVPAWATLNVDAGTVAGDGSGDLGTAQGIIDLGDATAGEAKDVVTGIGSGYTGTTESSDGVPLDYTLEIDEYDEVYSGSNYTIDVVYTLTQAE